jgi:hypothetical protein
MSALDLIATARDATFAARVAFVGMKAAVNVANEALDADDHAVRVQWANKMLLGNQNSKVLASIVIASNPTIQATILANPENRGSDVPDDHIEFAIASVVTALGHAEAAG